MNGLYLYCVRLSNGGLSKVKGIDGKSQVRKVLYKDIEAVVSQIDLKKFGSKEIARRAREDVAWIVKHAQRHEAVIEAAMGAKKDIAVIPTKFGTLFKNQNNLDKALQQNFQKFKKILGKLVGKQEWSVKVYVKRDAFRKKLVSENKDIQRQLKKAKQLPQGVDYFKEIDIEKQIEELVDQKIEQKSREFLKILKTEAVNWSEGKALSTELAGKLEPMILNSAYLVEHKKFKNFEKKVKVLMHTNKNYIFDMTGPWPPYNFI
jgi:hypothetical protein